MAPSLLPEKNKNKNKWQGLKLPKNWFVSGGVVSEVHHSGVWGRLGAVGQEGAAASPAPAPGPLLGKAFPARPR